MTTEQHTEEELKAIRKKEKKEKKKMLKMKQAEDAIEPATEEIKKTDKKDKKEKKEKKEKKRKEFSTLEQDLEMVNQITKKRSVEAQEDQLNAKKTKASSPSGYTYIQSSKLDAVSDSMILEFLKKNEISLKPIDASLKPILKFNQVDFPTEISQVLAGFENPTPIQSVSWPPILSGKDLIGIAKTGSGKTMAFGIPAYLRLHSAPSSSAGKKSRVLVLSPTRELACQIQEQFDKLDQKSHVKSVCIYGGVPKYEQKQALRSGVSVIVATPGRLLDLVECDQACDLSEVDYFVLDEADRMLDFGFEEAIRKIVSFLPKSGRQTVMFRFVFFIPLFRERVTLNMNTSQRDMAFGNSKNGGVFPHQPRPHYCWIPRTVCKHEH